MRYPALLLASLFVLSACGGGGGGSTSSTSPPPTTPPPTTTPSAAEQLLDTPRFTTHQPDVLEQIGAHHAYALGLKGQGVRIGIDDTIVDYTQTDEFGDRVKLTHADGAVLTYPRPLGPSRSDIAGCNNNPNCRLYVGNSGGDPDSINQRARDVIAMDGWPLADDTVFGVDEHYSAQGVGRFFRWHELPTPFDAPHIPGIDAAHGTAVASTAGKRLEHDVVHSC